MTDFQYAKVTEDFDPASFEGALVVCPTIYEGQYFSEQAWDEGELEDVRIVRVRSLARNPANYEDLEIVLTELGIDLQSGEPENVLPGLVCNDPRVRAALEAKGFDSVDVAHGLVVANWETGAKILWNPETFEVLPEPTDKSDISVDAGENGLRLVAGTSAGMLEFLRVMSEYGSSLMTMRDALERLIESSSDTDLWSTIVQEIDGNFVITELGDGTSWGISYRYEHEIEQKLLSTEGLTLGPVMLSVTPKP